MATAKAGGGTIQIRQFNGGIVTDPRDPTANKFLFASNFDTLTEPFKLVPYYDSINGDTNSTTNEIQNFCVAKGASAYNLYGLGVVSGTGKAEVFFKGLTTGSPPDLGSTGWGTTANNQSSSGATDLRLFVYYQTAGLIYGAKTGTDFWAYDPTGSASFAETSNPVMYTNVCQGLVHSMNDILYVGQDNKISANNSGWLNSVLTLPPNLYIIDLAEYGNYLAILAAPLNGVGNSKLFLWDMSSTTWNLMIDCGDGVGKIVNMVNGILITISISTNEATGVSRITFREYTTKGMVPIAVFQGASGDILNSYKQVADERLLFSMALTVDGATRAGVWSASFQGKVFSVVQERPVNNNTPLATGNVLGGFIKVEGFTLQSYTSSNNWAMSLTNSTDSYTANSLYETAINPEMPPADKIQLKQLMAVGAMYESLPSGASVVVQYRVDGGAWTTIFTETTAGVVYTEPHTVDAAATAFTDGKEYEFNATSTGGAQITALLYKYTIIPTTL